MSNNISIKFGKWLVIHTKETPYTLSPCRRYKNVIYTIDELFDIFINL